MEISDLRDNVTATLLDFAWNEWAQLGVLADIRKESPWAADPEALLVFSLQIARSDPRLFEEILDWLARNASSISLQRLRNHYNPADERLGESALAWALRHGGRIRTTLKTTAAEPEVLFYGATRPNQWDDAFRANGLLKPPSDRSKKSRTPDLRLPINFAFRLRAGFGNGSRAEVMRFLLTADAPQFTTAAITDAVAFNKRVVHDTLTALASAGWVQTVDRGNERLYAITPERWRSVVWFDDRPLPLYRDWTMAFQALSTLHRWLNDAAAEQLTPYMLASEARRVMESIAPSLSYAGFRYRERAAAGADYWPVFVDVVEQILQHLEDGLS